jgi:hypothetical protein
MREPRLIFGVFALSLASTGCLRQKTQARVFTPPPPVVRPAPPADADAPLKLPDAPQLEVDRATTQPPPMPDEIDLTGEIPDAPRRVSRRPTPPVAAPRPAQQVPVPVEPQATPRLAQMFTPEELRENTRSLEESLERVNKALATVEGKNLSVEQREVANRIRTFRLQAEQAREKDLLTAVSLARRADLLAKDLLEHLP